MKPMTMGKKIGKAKAKEMTMPKTPKSKVKK